jgi:Asp-tRNA(Asn)/Glu-tRNA(Gln) amidotransferase A subunit family amidase
VELTSVMLQRIAALNPALNAFTDVIAERALGDARRLDRTGGWKRPLGGLPIAVKDIIDTTPAVCSAGLPFLSDHRPDTDAAAVRRLRRQGAVVLGVTATDPGAFDVRTPAVAHPQAPGRTVGGSSGGSGAALAAGLALGALGTDTGGSIRVPAACCAIAGLKPTRGRLSLAGVRPLVWSLDHVGPMARTAADLRLLFAAMDPRRPARAPGRRPVVGFDPEYGRDAAPAVAQGVEAALAAARAAGASLRPVRLPDPEAVGAVHAVVFAAESAAYHGQEFPDRLALYPASVRRYLDLARTVSGADYVAAMRRRAEMTRAVDAALDAVDAVILPTLPVLTPPVEAETLEVGGARFDFTWALVRYTCLFDHSGHPVVAIPAKVEAPGIASSVQIVGRRHGDAALMRLAERLEEALGLAIDYEPRAP